MIKLAFQLVTKLVLPKGKHVCMCMHMYIFLGQLVSHVRKHTCIFISLSMPKYIPGVAEI